VVVTAGIEAAVWTGLRSTLVLERDAAPREDLYEKTGISSHHGPIAAKESLKPAMAYAALGEVATRERPRLRPCLSSDVTGVCPTTPKAQSRGTITRSGSNAAAPPAPASPGSPA
jgi:hypothetical protein